MTFETERKILKKWSENIMPPTIWVIISHKKKSPKLCTKPSSWKLYFGLRGLSILCFMTFEIKLLLFFSTIIQIKSH